VGSSSLTSSARPAPKPGTARAALVQQDFRRLYFSTFSSSVGSWMQTVVVGPLALRLGGESFVGLLMFANFGPILLLSIPAGALAAKIRNRRRYMISMQTMQIAVASFLAAVSANGAPNKWLLLLGVLGGGVLNSLNGPVSQTLMPEIVGRENIPAAVSLGSAQMNGSRVVGPVTLALVSQVINITPSMVFLFNALTFGAVIWALATIRFPPVPERPSEVMGFRSLSVGVRELKVNPVARRVLGIMFGFSLMCLAYVPQFPSIAEGLLGMDSQDKSYMFMFGTWGFGALCGALSMSTLFAAIDKRPLPRRTLIGFAALMAVWASQRSASLFVHAVLLVLGFCYFATTTALNTLLQQSLTPQTRPYVMSLWFMCFGGTIPLAGLWAGWLMDSSLGAETGAAMVLVTAAGVAGFLALLGDLRSLDRFEPRGDGLAVSGAGQAVQEAPTVS
jgi:MFS family permease